MYQYTGSIFHQKYAIIIKIIGIQMKRLAMKKNKIKSGSIIQSIFKTFLLSLTIAAQVHFAYAQSVQGGIIPNGEATFLDKNGKPLTSGKVFFYTQNTTTPKATYQDINLTTPNTNPVVLDAAGRALLWGNGVYRQQVLDRNNNLIWDVTTTSGGSGSTGPTATGDGDAVGTVKPWAGATPPNQYMFTYGQTLSRSTFQPLYQAITSIQNVSCTSGNPTISGLSDTNSFWIGMTVEVPCVPGGVSTVTAKTSFSVTLAANANATEVTTATFFMWGNGDGATTFNLPDYRGLVPVGNNIMGGIAGTAISDTYFGSKSASSAGASGGVATGGQTLITANLPPQTPSGHNTGNNTSISSSSFVFASPAPINTVTAGSTANPGTVTAVAPGNLGVSTIQLSVAAQAWTGTAFSGQNSTPFSVVQPSKTINFIIKVTPDTAFSGTGVTSLGGMTGDIVCGSGLTCAGNTISSTQSLTPPTASVLGGVFSKTCSTSNWFNTLDNTGTFGCSQPSFSDISGTLPNSQLATVGAATFKGNPTASAGVPPSDFTIQGLTARGAPDATNDKIPIYDNAAGTIKYVSPGQIAASATAGVSSIAGNTGAFTLGTGLTNAGNQLQNVGVVNVYTQTFCPSGCTTTIAGGASGTYTAHAGLIKAIFRYVAGGAGGGGLVSTAARADASGGGGAGGGALAHASGATIGASQNITIGAGGAGGVGANNGTAGGNTCIGGSGACGGTTLAVVVGGTGGANSGAAQIPTGGTGGTGATFGTGMIGTAIDGGAGGGGYSQGTASILGSSGMGGVSALGGGAAGAVAASATSVAGVSATGWGGGGGGAVAFTNATSRNGGAGQTGYVEITEYCNQ